MNNNIISNEEILDIFKYIDEFKDVMSESDIKKKRDSIVERLSFLVYSQTKMYKSFPNYEDLVQEGFVGLIKAVNRFDYKRFPNFFVFCSQWIRHYIKRAASKFDVVYSPDRQRVIYSELGQDEEEEDYDYDLEEIIFSKEKERVVKEVISTIPERERDIISKSFGFIDGGPQTLRQIGGQLDLTHERVRQLKNNTLEKLKKNKRLIQLIDGSENV